jgi:hypothetical protein
LDEIRDPALKGDFGARPHGGGQLDARRTQHMSEVEPFCGGFQLFGVKRAIKNALCKE